MAEPTKGAPLLALINSFLGSAGLVGIVGLIWTISGYANRIENLDRAAAETKVQVTSINETLKAFPLAADRLAQAMADIKELRVLNQALDDRLNKAERVGDELRIKLERPLPVRETQRR